MAWTKPLIRQQAECVIRDAGIQFDDHCVLNATSKNRHKLWREKRFFSCIPQCVISDIKSNHVDLNRIRLVIIDEAHRALGNFAYCTVIKQIMEKHSNFRIVGLTATPERNKFYEVVKNLYIQDVAYYTENSPEISKFKIEEEYRIVDLTPDQIELLSLIRKLMVLLLELLNKRGLFQGMLSRVDSLLPYECMLHQKNTNSHKMWPMMFNHYSALHRLAQFRVSLQNFGIRQLSIKVEELTNSKDPEAAKKNDKILTVLKNNVNLRKMYAALKSKLFRLKSNPTPDPKLACVTEILSNFFENGGSSYEQRILVFCNNRSVVEEVRQYVTAKTSSRVRVQIFIGHGGSSGAKGTPNRINQKDQMDILDRFKKGEINVLISTSIGEEGLDIPGVDLVVHYDHPKSLTRNIQRQGRTGRSNKGKNIYIMNESEKLAREHALEQHKKDANFISELVVNNPQQRRIIWRAKLDHEPPTWPTLYPHALPDATMKKLHDPDFNYSRDEQIRTPQRRKSANKSILEYTQPIEDDSRYSPDLSLGADSPDRKRPKVEDTEFADPYFADDSEFADPYMTLSTPPDVSFLEMDMSQNNNDQSTHKYLEFPSTPELPRNRAR